MSPTIRIDDEVWAWLKGLAQPLEDTPNTVLRRVAGLDQAPAEAREPTQSNTDSPRPSRQEAAMHHAPATQPRLSPRITGEQLNRRYQLGARHALYHRDGTFYERLTRFPGVLCDSRGFVRYETQEQFEGDSRLKIGQKVNVPGGLYSHPRYERFPGL